MKDLGEQIKYLDTVFLPLFGIKSIIDYETEVSTTILSEDDEFLNKINNEIDNLKRIFPAREFSLHKTNNEIKTHKQAFSFLLKCLSIANVLHNISNKRNVTHVRLISENIVLKRYIENTKMFSQNTENRQFVDKNENHDSNADQKELQVDLGKCMKYNPFQGAHTNGALLPKSIQITEEEYRESIIDKGNVVNFKVPLTTFFTNKQCISTTFLKQNIKNIRINAEIMDTASDENSTKTTNTLMNKMIGDVNYRFMVQGMTLFGGKFEFGTNLIPDNMYMPFGYLLHTSCDIQIDIPERLRDQFNNSMVLSIDVDVVRYKARVRRKLQSNYFDLKLKIKDSYGKDNILICTSGIMGLKYNRDDRSDIEKDDDGGIVLPLDAEVDDFEVGNFNCRMIKTGNDDTRYALLYTCVGKMPYDICGTDDSHTYKIDAYQIKGDDIVFYIDLLHDGDTVSDIKLMFSNNNITSARFRLLYRAASGEELEAHDLDFTSQVETDNERERTVFKIDRYHREHMLHHYKCLQTTIQVTINKDEFIQYPVNVVDVCMNKYFWAGNNRDELFSYRKKYDFVESLTVPKAIKIWRQIMRSMNMTISGHRSGWKNSNDMYFVPKEKRIRNNGVKPARVKARAKPNTKAEAYANPKAGYRGRRGRKVKKNQLIKA
jgi:hypothetical protein